MKDLNPKLDKIQQSPPVSPLGGLDEKNKLKRRIVNSFKRFSIKKSKSFGISNVSKSDSDLSRDNDSPGKCTPRGGKPKFIEESFLTYMEDSLGNSFDSTIPFTIRSINEYPEMYHDSITTTKEKFQEFIRPQCSTEIKQPNILINPADLPSISSEGGVVNEAKNSVNHNLSKNVFLPKDNVLNSSEKSSFKSRRPFSSSRFDESSKWQALCVIPTTFIPETSNTLNLPLSLGLKEVLDLSVYLKESENNVKHTISKYITNENLQNELIQVLSSYAKNHVENERRIYRLAKEMFVEETEVLKAREKTLQDSLDIAVQMNRFLEEELESLKTDSEKIFIDYEHESQSYVNRKKHEEELIRNNNEIRTKYRYVLGEIKKLENELRSLQNQNHSIINQLATSNGQIRSYRDMLHKAITDHELEQVALTNQLAATEQIIKESVEAGDVLMEDLDAIKRQLKNLPCTINWSKFKCRGSTLTDLLHLTRACLNELARELVNIHNQINIHNKSSSNEGTEKNKLIDEIIKLKSNDERLQLRIESLLSYETKFEMQSQKNNMLQSELEMYKKENSIIHEQLAKEKSININHEKAVKTLQIQLAEKDLIIMNLNANFKDHLTENTALKFQIDSMKKLLDESKLSSVLQELMDAQEKCAYYQGQYFQLETEKLNILEQSKKSNAEKENLLKHQQSFYEHLQKQQQELEQLNQQNNDLKQQLIFEREKLVEKNAELTKQLQELNVMKTVQTQFHAEYSKNVALESNAISTNFEMNRLTVVAEYNNEISKQLKSMIEAKDKTIAELKDSLESMQLAEKNNFAEKSSLINEVNEASYIIKQLQNELSNENKKLQETLEDKVKLQRDADHKIHELHNMLLQERQALQDLLVDHKNVMSQKCNLITAQKDYLEQIQNYKSSETNLQSSLVQLENKHIHLEEHCVNLKKELQSLQKIIESKENTITKSEIEYENKLATKDNMIENLKHKNEEFESTIQYLQCAVNNLQTTIDQLRSNEKIYKDKIENYLETITKFFESTEEQKHFLEQCNSDYKILEEKLANAIDKQTTILNEYNDFIKESQEKQESLLNDIENYKNLNITKTESLRLLALDSQAKCVVLENQKEELDRMKNELQNFEKIQEDFDEKSRLLEEALIKQEELDQKWRQEEINCLQKIDKLTQTVKKLQVELASSIKQRENDVQLSKTFLEETINLYENQKQEKNEEINNLKNQLCDKDVKYEEKCKEYENLVCTHKELAEHISKAIYVLIQEKRELQKIKVEKKNLVNTIAKLNSKLLYANDCIKVLTEINSKNIAKTEEIESAKIKEMKAALDEAQNSIDVLENQLKQANEKLECIDKNTVIEKEMIINELKTTTENLKKADAQILKFEDRYTKIKQQLKIGNDIIIKLKQEIAQLHQKVQVLDFQKCELTLRFHEINSKYRTEQEINLALKDKDHQCRHLAAIAEEEEEVVPSASETSLESERYMLTFK